MNETNKALQKIARGTGIIFVGTIISMFFGFLSRAIIARYFSTAEYGVFNLALTVLSIALVVATLGFQSALPREVAVYREKSPSRLKDLISTALIIVFVNSLLLSIVLILGSECISEIFNEPKLISSLKIMALALPFSTLILTLISISRGFGRVKEQVYFQNILFPTLFLLSVLIVTILNFSFSYVFVAYIIAQSLTFLILLVSMLNAQIISIRFRLNTKLARELITFSLPLLFSGILTYLMGWTDTLMIGYYKPSSYVGLYNAASPIAKLISIFLMSAGFIYVPIVSQLYAKGKLEEMGRVYQILTKWMFLLTFPIFALVFLFPDVVINFTFGAKYAGASIALRILSLGMMFHIILGLNGWTLIVIGEAFLNMIGDLIAVIANVILNILLIPAYGIEGAAVATTVSYFVAKLFRWGVLYKKTGIHPFTFTYTKSLFLGFIGIGGLYIANLSIQVLWHALFVLALFLLFYLILLLMTKCIDREDVEMFLLIEKKLGINFKIVREVLKRFV